MPSEISNYFDDVMTVEHLRTLTKRRCDIHNKNELQECIQKFPDWPPGARTANGTALCHKVQLYRYFVSQSSEFWRHDPLCCFPTSVYCCRRIYFIIDTVRKLLDTPSYTGKEEP
jgi:hypothetical protein